jgi:hypothetical protein
MFQSQLNFAEKKEGYEVLNKTKTYNTLIQYGTMPFK